MVRVLVLGLALVSCVYQTHFSDCAVRCSDGCPDGLTCGGEGLCRTAGQTQTCAAIMGDAGTPQEFPSCVGLAATCGPAGNEDCCSTAMPIPGGTFYRSVDFASDAMYSDMSYPATVSSFVLDRFEVTVGRFRAFVNAGLGTQADPPAAGAGAHAKVPGSGWDPNWDGALSLNSEAFTTALQCDSWYQTWTTTAGANESLPINCVTWYEAQAFCTWDGGFLPSEAEWNYAAAGGSEQRSFPWSVPASTLTTDCSYANYVLTGTIYCNPGTGGPVALLNRVGSESPRGDGRWGQADLAGNAWEWTLDTNASYIVPCDDCASIDVGAYHVIRGGNFSHDQTYTRTANRGLPMPASRSRDVGFRCARNAAR